MANRTYEVTITDKYPTWNKWSPETVEAQTAAAAVKMVRDRLWRECNIDRHSPVIIKAKKV